MKSLRAPLLLAGMLLLPVSALSAQASRVGCKDGSAPKIGHFTCWGHGGVVTLPMKSAAHAEKKAAASATKAEKHKAKASAKKSATPGKKKSPAKAHSRRPTRNSAK
jgi:hypothetical protein